MCEMNGWVLSRVLGNSLQGSEIPEDWKIRVDLEAGLKDGAELRICKKDNKRLYRKAKEQEYQSRRGEGLAATWP